MVRRSRDWVVGVRRLLRKLSKQLSETVDACQHFHNHGSRYIRDLPDLKDHHRLFPAIWSAFNELQVLGKRLAAMADLCGDFAQDVSSDYSLRSSRPLSYNLLIRSIQLGLQLVLENSDVGHRQHEVAQQNKRLGLLMLVSTSSRSSPISNNRALALRLSCRTRHPDFLHPTASYACHCLEIPYLPRHHSRLHCFGLYPPVQPLQLPAMPGDPDATHDPGALGQEETANLC